MSDGLPKPVTSTQIVVKEAPQVGLKRAEECTGLLSLFDPGHVEEALRISGWTVAKEIQLLAEIAEGVGDGEGGVSAGDRMKAAKELRHIGRSVLGLGQGIAIGRRMTTMQTANGPVTEETQVIQAMGPHLERAAEIIRTQLAQADESDIIDVEHQETH